MKDLTKKRVVVIDHFDSFTQNMVAILTLLGAKVWVVRTDCSLSAVKKFNPTHIVLSAGKGHPKDVALFHQVLGYYTPRSPVFGICLGHQVIGLHFGADIVRCQKIMHGKMSAVSHSGANIFSGVRNWFTAMRYHSFTIEKGSLCSGLLRQTARTADGVVMGVESVQYPHIVGVQFHPESYFTESGPKMFSNFLATEVKK